MNNTTSSVRCPKCGRALPAEASEGICPACALAAIATPTEAGQPAGERPAPPSLETVAAAFSQLEIVELIGVGGMGAVYKARQPKLDRFVALKLLERPLAREGTFAGRFHREARLLARLNHPGIVSVYDYGEAGGFFYLLMEYVDGVNLRQAMRAGRFTPEQALTLVPKICEALQYAHDEGILHRDIKPENILLDLRGRVKIADFGIAKLVDARNEGAALTASGLAVGTPHYMAPEQLEHPQDVDQRADIYSLGVVFYELLTGELPIGRFAPPSRKTPVDPRVDQVVLRALEKERERRQRNVTEVKEQVETIATSPAPPATVPAGEPDPKGMGLEPKVSFCLVSTPEYLRSFRGRFLNICQGKGELRLQGGTLTFQSGWQAVFIPLRSIRVLARGDYPASAKPVPLSYLGVTYEEHGHARTLLFTPMLVALAPPWETNALVAEWAAAVQQAVRQATGQELEIEVSNAAENWSWVELAKTYVLTAAGATAAFALIPLIAERRFPNRLSELVWGPVTAALTLGLLLVARWWRRRLELAAARATELRPWERSWLRLPESLRRALRTGLLLASAVLVLFFLSFSVTGRTEKGWASSEWSVGAFDPWLQKWAHFPRSGFLLGIEVNLASSSFACGIGALLLGVLGLAASRIEAIGRHVAPPPRGGHGADSADAPTRREPARVSPPVNPVRDQPGQPADSPGLRANYALRRGDPDAVTREEPPSVT